MGIRRSSFHPGRRRKGEAPGLSERIETITTPRDRPPSVGGFGSGVIAPGTSRYQRMSAHLPSGVTPFRGLRVLPADVSIDLTSEEPTVALDG
jgi:hypothetical protein